MLVQFKTGNFLSFKNPVILSMVATAIGEHEENNVFQINGLNLLKGAVIYGANASGKSNLFKAILFMRRFVLNSSKETQANEKIGVTNFKLSSETDNKPSLFEIVFICDGVRHRYGFEVDKNEVHREWLYFVPKRQETKLFVREKDKVELGTYFKKEGKDLIQKTRKNALFLSVVAQFNGAMSINILNWFKKKLRVISGLDDTSYVNFTFNKIKSDADYKAEILKLLKIGDLAIGDIEVDEKKLDISDIPKGLPEGLKNLLFSKPENLLLKSIRTSHQKFNNENQPISIEQFDFMKEESEGTKKLFSLSGPIVDTLKNGYCLVVDEFDSRLHPLLTKAIVSIFNSQLNILKAQLIIVSHDTNLLSKDTLRRDQIWFTEKNRFGSSDLYSLVEYVTVRGKVRNDASYGKDYILGKYGAIPYIGDIKSLLE